MKKILITLLSLLISSFALAEIEVKLTGSYQFYQAIRTGHNEYNNSPNNYLTANHKNHKFVTFAENNLVTSWLNDSIYLKEYGAKLKLISKTTSNEKFTNDFNKGYLFLNSFLGKLHLGTDYNVSTNMSFSAYDVAAGTGGASNGDFSYYIFNQFWDSHITDQYYLQKITHLYSLRYKTRTPYKIAYYSPKINDFSLGVSFAPDGANFSKEDKENFTNILSKTKNITSIALNYSKDIQEYSFNFSATYDSARINSKSDEYLDSQNPSLGMIDLANFSSYTFGSLIKYQQVYLAASKGISKNFLQQKYLSVDTALNNHKSKFLTFGISYSWDAFLASITYLKDWQDCGNNTINSNYFSIGQQTKAISFALDYSIYYGMKLFIEYNKFNLKSASIGSDNSGGIFIFGSKISF